MDSSLAPMNVAPFLGRWRVHGLHGAVTPALEQEVGIGDVFDVMPVEGTERHALAVPLGSTACHTVTGPRHQQLLHLPLSPRLLSTFAAPTSAGPRSLSGSRRTKNACSRPRTFATSWRTACSMGQNPAAVVPVLLPLARRRLCGGVHAKGKLTSWSGEQLTRRWGATASCHPNCPTACGWRSGQPAKHPAHPARRSASVGCSQHARTPTP